MQRFGLGLAPDSRTALKRALEKLGEDKLVETGMLIQPDEGEQETYDRFRGRLMIPIRDPRGRVIGFGGRILGDGEPKYLNSPQTRRSSTRAGRSTIIDRAGPASRTARRLIVVEGYMDVIALDRAGICEAVAPNGTALTEAQLERHVAARSLADPVLRRRQRRRRPRSEPRIAPFPTSAPIVPCALSSCRGQDPDDVIRSGGREASRRCSPSPNRSTPRLWRHELEAEPLTTPEAWASLKQRSSTTLLSSATPTLAGSIARTGSAASMPIAAPRAPPHRASHAQRGTFKNGRFVPADARWRPKRDHRIDGIDAPTARALIMGFANYPEELPAHCEQLAALPISDKRPRKCATSSSTRPFLAPA